MQVHTKLNHQFKTYQYYSYKNSLKIKENIFTGLENNDFSEKLDVGNFVKFARSFYQSKGVEESIRILFKVLVWCRIKNT